MIKHCTSRWTKQHHRRAKDNLRDFNRKIELLDVIRDGLKIRNEHVQYHDEVVGIDGDAVVEDVETLSYLSVVHQHHDSICNA